jgi:DNA polymerase-4
MVDNDLPIQLGDQKLRYLFLDLNSYFAAVEQQEHPELRGRPVAVAPVMAETSVCVAASYEAKAFGVRCGTMVGEARRMCPGIEILGCRPKVYVHYHERVLKAVEDVLPIDEVCSIDEMRCRLLGTERTPEVAVELAQKIKANIRDRVGECLTSSIGIAPNAFLAKVATELQKPDGLVVLPSESLPDALLGLKLTDFPGINKRMEVRLNAAGIFTTRQMCAASRKEMLRAFGSVVGERWWYLLRGHDFLPEVQSRKTLGHSHVLGPERRTEAGVREVLLRLIQKASARLRANGLWAQGMGLSVSGFGKSWQAKIRMPATQDATTLVEAFQEAWQNRDFVRPRTVGVVFYHLKEAEEVTPSLFDEVPQRVQLSRAIDRVNQKFGKNAVFLAAVEGAKDTADEKIAFNKTWLFSEGKGDNEWDEEPV